MFFGEEGAERHAGGDWLGDGDDVGDDCEALEGEQFAGAAETALDLVENERGLMMVGQGAAGKEEFFGTFEDSALAEDGFQHDGAGVGVDGGVERFNVVLRYKGHVFEHGLKAFAIFFLAGQRHGAESSSVVGTLQSDELRFGIAAGFVSGEACQFDGTIHGLGAAVGEKDAIEAGELAQACS